MSLEQFKIKSARILVATAVMCNTCFGFAGTKAPTPKPISAPVEQSAPTDGPGVPVKINPQTLQSMLFKRNLNIQLELQNLYTAKASVSVAAANLLPSLNLNLSAATNLISFAISTISFLVPFLIPGNWLLLNEAKDQYKAEGLGYYLTKLNNLASIESMYYTVVSDIDTLTVLKDQQTINQRIYGLVKTKYNIGLATQGDLKQAQENLDVAKARVVDAQKTIDIQNQAIIQLVNLDPETVLDVDMQHETASVLEGKTVDEISKAVVTTSPEWLQMDYLIAAAVEKMKATEFSFLSAFTMSSAAGAVGETASFNSLKSGVAFNIGPAIIPNVKLSAIAIDIEKTEQIQVKNSEDFAIGTTVATLNAEVAELAYYQDAEDSSRVVYNEYLNKYETGNTDLIHVFGAATDLITQEMNRITSQSNVDNQRVALKRIDREQDFAAIKECNLQDLGSHQKWFKKIGNIFSSPKISVDQACANTNQEPDISSDNKTVANK
jgi:outer membrane protein, multidrug efflux system